MKTCFRKVELATKSDMGASDSVIWENESLDIAIGEIVQVNNSLFTVTNKVIDINAHMIIYYVKKSDLVLG